MSSLRLIGESVMEKVAFLPVSLRTLSVVGRRWGKRFAREWCYFWDTVFLESEMLYRKMSAACTDFGRKHKALFNQ
jgi:hypothetical protein